MAEELQLKERCEMACTILRKTNDGGDLDPQHLWLVQEAVNGSLTALGWDAFKQLYDSCLKGYKHPWFHDIEHLIRRQGGDVYWKGLHVEHYDSPWCWTEEGKKHAEELAKRCRHLESIGIIVSDSTAIWYWERYEGVKANENDKEATRATG
jgi:hypothetical protein